MFMKMDQKQDKKQVHLLTKMHASQELQKSTVEQVKWCTQVSGLKNKKLAEVVSPKIDKYAVDREK